MLKVLVSVSVLVGSPGAVAAVGVGCLAVVRVLVGSDISTVPSCGGGAVEAGELVGKGAHGLLGHFSSC